VYAVFRTLHSSGKKTRKLAGIEALLPAHPSEEELLAVSIEVAVEPRQQSNDLWLKVSLDLVTPCGLVDLDPRAQAFPNAARLCWRDLDRWFGDVLGSHRECLLERLNETSRTHPDTAKIRYKGNLGE
jgi:hypothetical protein